MITQKSVEFQNLPIVREEERNKEVKKILNSLCPWENSETCKFCQVKKCQNHN